MSAEHGHTTGEKIADAAEKVADSVRKAVEEGIDAIRPTWEDKVKPTFEEKVVPAWEDKVAPAIATGAGKVADWGTSARESADRKAAELNADDRPSSKILGGAAGIGAAAAALGAGAARWVSKEAGMVGGADDAETGPLDTEG